MADLIRKLRLQPGQRALILDAPAGYLAALGELPEGVTVATETAGEASFEFVHVFVRDSAHWRQIGPAASAAVVYDGIFWVSYPKRSARVDSDLSRDLMWELVEGMRPVTQISIDDTWSALRFRPAERVGT